MNASEPNSPVNASETPLKWPAFSIPTDPEGRKRLALAAIGLGIIFYAYFINNTCFLNITGSPAGSVARWLKVSWDRGEDFQHGYIVPFICAGLFYWKWK